MYFQKSFCNAPRTEQVIGADCPPACLSSIFVVLSRLRVAGGQPLNSSVMPLNDDNHSWSCGVQP